MGGWDPAEEVALVAHAKREVLLRVHRHRLRREDLEDCYSQATLELLAHVRRGGGFSSRAHLGNTLEQRFLSRIHDRRRALSGRSPTQAALEAAIPLGDAGEQMALVDRRTEPETLAILRQELRRVSRLAQELTDDQRLILACQVGLDMRRTEFCRRFGWSGEKYRKVAQRARAHLLRLMSETEESVPLAAARRKSKQGPTCEELSPTHRNVPRDAGGRLHGRAPGEAHPRASGRKPEISPPQLPAARVPRQPTPDAVAGR